MLKRITIVVPEAVADRLDRLAGIHYRDRKQQAGALLLEGLERAERQAERDRRRQAER